MKTTAREEEMSWRKYVPVSMASDLGLSAVGTAGAGGEGASENSQSFQPGVPNNGFWRTMIVKGVREIPKEKEPEMGSPILSAQIAD